MTGCVLSTELPDNLHPPGEGRKRNQVSMGAQSEVTLPGKVTEKNIRLLNASITAPSGLEEPCFLKKLDKDQLGGTFTNGVCFSIFRVRKGNQALTISNDILSLVVSSIVKPSMDLPK